MLRFPPKEVFKSTNATNWLHADNVWAIGNKEANQVPESPMARFVYSASNALN